MDVNNLPAGDALPACPASYEGPMDMAPQEAHQLGTPNAAPMPLDGGRTAPVAAPQCAAPPFVDPWLAEADAAGDPMLCGDALAPMAPMALTPPVAPTAPMDAAPTAAAAPMALTPAVPATAPMDAAPTATAAPMALTPAVPSSTSIAPMDAAPTAAAAPMALTPPAAPMALTPPAPRAASDAAAPPVVVVASAPAATKSKRVKRQTIGPGGPAAAAPPPAAPPAPVAPPAPAAPPPPAAAAPPPVAPPAPLAAPTAEAAPAPAAPPPPAAAAPPARPPLPPGARVNAKGETIVRLRRPPPPPRPPTPPPPPMNDVRVGARVAKSFPGFGARKWLGTISAQRTTGKWEVRWDDDPGYRQAYAETTMRKCLIHGAAAAPPPPPPTPATPATENRACLMCGESTRLPDGSLDADGCVRCDACAVEMCRDCSGQRRRRRTWRCDTCVNASGLGEAEVDDVVEEPAGAEERPMRRAASLDAATVLASRLDNSRNKPDVAASVLGPLAVAVPEARSRRPSDDTPPSNDDSDDDVATLRKWRSPSSSPRAGPAAAAAPARGRDGGRARAPTKWTRSAAPPR